MSVVLFAISCDGVFLSDCVVAYCWWRMNCVGGVLRTHHQMALTFFPLRDQPRELEEWGEEAKVEEEIVGQ